jgi:2-polyprenyl-3-methyl-5-hydroxy-6-metoxy-1,4-benzoquinol methylase
MDGHLSAAGGAVRTICGVLQSLLSNCYHPLVCKPNFEIACSGILRRRRPLKTVAEESRDQDRWDEIGKKALQDIENNQQNFVIDDFTFATWAPGYTKLLKILSPLQNKTILDLGCGGGNLSVVLAKKGARCIGIDIGKWLVATAQKKRR